MSRTFILIDPFSKAITEVEWDGELDSLYRLLDCQVVEAVRLHPQQEGRSEWMPDGVYIDEEGLLKSHVRDDSWWQIPNWWPHPLTGKALAHSIDGQGNEIPPHMSVQWYRDQIQWIHPIALTPWQVGWATR